jgi:hypothetical protein
MYDCGSGEGDSVRAMIQVKSELSAYTVVPFYCNHSG